MSGTPDSELLQLRILDAIPQLNTLFTTNPGREFNDCKLA
jgi:hypothetical protein